VDVSPDTLSRYATATYPTAPRPAAVVRPRDRDGLRDAVAVAHRHRVPVYPVSGGRNWGLGSRVPTADGAVILDLGGLDRILGLDREMATVTVEPGVTFEALAAHLAEHAPELVMDSIGSTGRASIVGNAVERGHGMGTSADRFAHVADLEVVLSDGDVVRTGFGAFDGSAVGGLAPWGAGPAIQGLFSQSGFGIVASLTLWLQPTPTHFQSFVFGLEDDEALARTVDGWRRERLLGTRASLRIFNDLRLTAIGGPYPFEATGGATPLPEDLRRKLSPFPGRWVGIGSVSAPDDATATAQRQRLGALFGPLAEQLEIYDERWAERVRAEGSDDERAWLDFVYDRTVLRGHTSDRPIRMCYWRQKDGAPEDRPLDPDRDGCGVLWYCPAIPATGRDAVALADIVERRSREHGFEPNVGFLSISERTLDVTGAVVYDRAVAGEDERARACHDAILDDCHQAGYPPYRLGVGSMERMARQRPANRRLLRRLERALDPRGILAPGRYAADPLGERPRERSFAVRHVRAVDDPDLARRFLDGQHRALDGFAVSGVDSSASHRLENPACHLFLLFEDDELLGGVRLDGHHPDFALPIRTALGDLLPEAEAERWSGPGWTELCGLWYRGRRDGRRGQEGTLLLVAAALAAAPGLGVERLVGLPHQGTLGLVWSFGFTPVGSVGDGGRFVYPDERYVSTLCTLDLETLASIPEPRRSLVESLARGERLEIPTGPESGARMVARLETAGAQEPAERR
jgi:4-cresol dehydrogenase (hydroxylating)